MTKHHYEKIADLCQVMGNVNRVHILFLCLKSPVSVGELVEKLGISQSLVSHNLRYLREVKLVRPERHGRRILYAVDDEHVRCILNDLFNHVKEIK